jgi:hypothetical protein
MAHILPPDRPRAILVILLKALPKIPETIHIGCPMVVIPFRPSQRLVIVKMHVGRLESFLTVLFKFIQSVLIVGSKIWVFTFF